MPERLRGVAFLQSKGDDVIDRSVDRCVQKHDPRELAEFRCEFWSRRTPINDFDVTRTDSLADALGGKTSQCIITTQGAAETDDD